MDELQMKALETKMKEGKLGEKKVKDNKDVFVDELQQKTLEEKEKEKKIKEGILPKENKSVNAVKVIVFIIGALLILGTLAGGSLSYLGDWSTAELVGMNAWTIIAICGGGFLCYWGVKK